MRFFTKEWYTAAYGSMEKTQSAINSYLNYCNTIQSIIPQSIFKALDLHDNVLQLLQFYKKECIMVFDTSKALSTVKELIFENYTLLSADGLNTGAWCLYSEISIKKNAYEVGLLFQSFEEDHDVLHEFLIRAQNIKYKQ